jgi:hypothetical protein
MPLQDRAEFIAWLEDRNGNMVGRRHGDPGRCDSCGLILDHELDSTDCLVCLAEQFGIDTAHVWIAEAFSGLTRAAVRPSSTFGPLLRELIHAGREIVHDRRFAT